MSRDRATFDGNIRPRASGAYALPPWPTLTCASTGRAAILSASAVQPFSYGANAARAQALDGATFDLLLEPARTNVAKSSRAVGTTGGGGWTVDATIAATLNVTDGVLAPDGTATATRLVYAGAGSAGGTIINSIVVAAAPAGNRYACSIWLRCATGTVTLRFDTNQSGAVGDSAPVVTTTWKRFEIDGAQINNAAVQMLLQRAVGNNDPSTLYAWGASCESGRCAGSLITTTTASVTRDADVLAADPELVCPGGWIDLDVTFLPGFATGEQSVDAHLLRLAANDRVFLENATKKIVLRVGGADVLSSALTWSRHQPLRVRALHGPRGRRVIVSGATTGNGSATAAAASAISLPGTAYVMGTSSGADEIVSLRRIRFGDPRRR